MGVHCDVYCAAVAIIMVATANIELIRIQSNIMGLSLQVQ